MTGLGLVQHLFGIFRKTSGDGIGLSRLEEQQIFVRPSLIKGIVHIPFPGHPVKGFGIAGQLYTVGGNAVGHELFDALLAVGRFACPVFLGDLTANSPECIGKAPGCQFTCFHGNSDCATGNVLFDQSLSPSFFFSKIW